MAEPISLRPVRVEDAAAMTAVLERRYTVQVQGHSADHAEEWINHLVVIGTPWKGRGIAGHAGCLLLRDLRRRGVGQVIAHIHPGHRASQRVATSLGLAPTSTVVDGEQRWTGRLANALTTARLRLRAPDPADLGTVLRLLRDPRATGHNPADASPGRHAGPAADGAVDPALAPARHRLPRGDRAGRRRAPRHLRRQGDDGAGPTGGQPAVPDRAGPLGRRDHLYISPREGSIPVGRQK